MIYIVLEFVYLFLVTGRLPFKDYNEYNDARLDFDSFLTKFEKVNNINKLLSEEFKELFKRMISFKEENRPSIEEIIDNYLKDIKSLKDDELKKLEEDLNNEFQNREVDINEIKHQELEICDNDENNQDDRTSGEEIIFTDEKPFPINEKEFDNYIKINGNLQCTQFMNILYEGLKNYDREKDKEWLEFTITVERDKINEEDSNKIEEVFKKELEKEEEENEEEGDDDESEQELKIKLTLCEKSNICEKSNNEYYLRFLKESGDWEEYYDKFKEIVKIIKEEIL